MSDCNNFNSEPKKFKLSELINNGSNIGIEKQSWKPVIGVTDFGFRKYHPYGNPEWEETEHYYDNTSLISKSEWEIWDESERNYIIEKKPLTERQKKIHSLIKITITGNDGKVIYSDDNNEEEKKIFYKIGKSEQKNKRTLWQKIFGKLR